MRGTTGGVAALEQEPLVPSRFNSMTHLPSGEMLLFNSLTGSLGRVSSHEADRARAILMPGISTRRDISDQLISALSSGGFLVASEEAEATSVDELYLKKYGDDRLNLIIMPTEQCNFRCVYCYESFLKKEMQERVQDGVVRFVERQRGLRALDVNWFGGEPLLSKDLVIAMSSRLQSACVSLGAKYVSSMTTNGYFLTADLMAELTKAGVDRFQITLDGIGEEHDCRRVGKDGEATFERIISNLRELKSSDEAFVIMLRHNFDQGNLPKVPEFVEFLADEFEDDPRFVTFFHAIGQWGGPNDDSLDVCKGRAKAAAVIHAEKLAAGKGFVDGVMLDHFRPNGYACYAADPRSLVVAPDGQLHKCTVELDTFDRNIVGHVNESGEFDLDWGKIALWTETNGRDGASRLGKGASKCGSCHFSPTCHGAVCPKEWLDSKGEDCECPPHKMNVRESLPLLQIQTSLKKRQRVAD